MTVNNLCISCTNIGCEFPSGIVRTRCAFYMPPRIETDNCGNYVIQSKEHYNWESPITKIYGDIHNEIIRQDEENCMCTIEQAIGYKVDKPELIKALQYDRNQYDKGYSDGRASIVAEMAEFDLAKMADRVAEKALDEFTYDGKTLREWIEIIFAQDSLAITELEKIETQIIRNSRPQWEKLVIDVTTCQLLIKERIEELKGE